MATRLVLVGSLLLVFLSGLQGSQATRSLPSQLSDRDFFRLFTDLSEPGGSFQDENYVSNERFYQRAMPRLMESVKPGGVYVGVGPEQNFTYIAALEFQMAFILDIRRQNAMELLMYKALFELSTDRVDFVSRLLSLPRPAGLNSGASAQAIFDAFARMKSDRRLHQENLSAILDTLRRHGFDPTPEDRASIEKVFNAFYENGLAIRYIFRGSDENHITFAQLMTSTDDARRNWSFLATEEYFRRLKELQAKNLIVPVVGDFAGPKAVRAIGQYVRDNGGSVKVFYVSNVEPYLFQAGSWKNFYDSVATMPVDSSSLFIRTFFQATTRECRPAPMVMTPFLSSIPDFMRDYHRGDIKTQCDLVSRSK